MQRLELPDNIGLPFPELIGRVADYLLSFAPMWRSYWLQAVAVLDGENWLLHHLALVGQWSEFPGAERFCDYIPGGALIAVSQQVDETRFQEILASLRENGTIALPHNITARTPSGNTSSGLPIWQAPSPWVPHPIEEVAETAPWRDLHISDLMGWHPIANQAEKQEVMTRLTKALREDLDRRSEPNFDVFLSTKFARKPNQNMQHLDTFYYYLDFPLGLVIEPGPGDQAGNTRPLLVKCRNPLTLQALHLTVTRTWTSDAPVLPIDQLPPSDDGWSLGKVSVPYLCSRIRLTYEQTLARSLVYDLKVPTPEAQVTGVIGYIYNYGSPDKGLEGWGNDLLYGDGPKFELALLNALMRLGVRALFAGQLTGEGKSKGQPTPGFDLVALDYSHKQAVAISAKGSDRSPGYDEVQSLVEGVAILRQQLPGWRVHGIIACHAPSSRLGQFIGRPDVVVWSLENVAFLLYADAYDQIAGMLWSAPSPLIPHTFLG